MTIRLETYDGGLYQLPVLLRWDLTYTGNVPCDSMSVTCLYDESMSEVLPKATRFTACQDGEVMLQGVVDAYEISLSQQGLLATVEGRGMAALLLDNEAMPAEYQRCTRADIVAGHVAPYGLEAAGGEGLPAVSGFSVASGESEWSVVRRYACYYGGVTPRFDRQGRLVLDPPGDGRELPIREQDGVTGWEYREERHGVLSQVAVRRRTTWGTQWVSDPAFLAQGGRARRVVTVPNTTGTAAMRYTADYQLRAARRERVRMRFTAAGAFLAWPGELVRVELKDFGANGRYRVAQAEVCCGSGGLSTTLVLGEPDSMI